MHDTHCRISPVPATADRDSRVSRWFAAPGPRRGGFIAALVIATAFLLSLSAPVRADDVSELRKQLDAALQVIRNLESRVKVLEADRAAPAGPVAVPAPVAVEASTVAMEMSPMPAVPEDSYIPPQTARDNETAAQRVDNAPLDPTLKGFFKFPGTDTIMKVGGYVKVDFINDFKPMGTFDYFVTSAIPTSGPDTQHGSQFTAQAKQTRMNVELRRDTEAGPARLFVEADWFGNASVDFQPGSYQLQLRHAYGQLQNFAGGYSFSAFMDNDALPDTLDFEGPGAAPYLLLAGARYIWKAGRNTNVSLSVEAPQTQVTTPVGSGKSTYPDVTLRARYEADRGHVQLSGVGRRLGWNSGTGVSAYATGYGLNLAGSLKTVGEDYVVAGGVWGKGIARYVVDITGLGLDAIVDPNGNLQALEAYGGYAAYTHFWTPKLRSTGVVDYLGMNNKAYQPATSFTNSRYYSLNLIWSPWGSLNVGAEVLYGRYRTFDGNSANDTRIQLSAQYDFVR